MFCDEASFADRETELFCRPEKALANLDEHYGPNSSFQIFLVWGCNDRAFTPQSYMKCRCWWFWTSPTLPVSYDCFLEVINKV